MKVQKDFLEILSLCEFQDWEFYIGKDVHRFFLQIKAIGKCNVSGKPWNWSSRKWPLSPHMTDSEVVQTAFKAVMTAMEHETREQFKFLGESIFDPHYNVYKLAKLRKNIDCLDVREE